jgi:1,2-diacylglycerol 3-beta-glucosyltransferase
LGGSVGLKGNGMVFASDVLRRYEWSTSITEDIELHMALLLAGERVTFAPDAVVLGEMPDSLDNSKSQHLRWERGRIEMRRKYVPQLLKQTWRGIKAGDFRHAFVLFDAVMEHLIPPFSLLFGASVLLFLGNMILLAVDNFFNGKMIFTFEPGIAQWNFIWIGLLLVGQVFYLVAGLVSIRAPWFVYRSLLFAPVYIAWKYVQYVEVALRKSEFAWVRTHRNEG